MKNIIKILYMVLVLFVLFLIVTIPILILTFNSEQSLKVADDMFKKFVDFMIYS